MELPLRHELRDPIHGLIHLTDQEMDIVNTSVFQRLRRIRQLAMADLVYPGALHTRFEHSLGVMHVAQKIATRLDRIEQLSDNDLAVIRLAALLHDVGHGPFSHVSEYLLDQHYDTSKVGTASSREKIHEKITIDIITKVPELAELLHSDQRDAIVSILQGTGRRDFRQDIVSSSLDADKMDYLLRDAYYAGVRYGYYDLDKVIDACRILRRGRESYLAIHEEGIFAVEQLILSKHYMTQQVYAHRVRTVTDLMIVRGLELAIDTDGGIRSVYAYDGSPDHLRRYLDMDDAGICAAALSSDDLRTRAIFQRLRDRNLFKQLALIPIDETHIRDSLTRKELLDLTKENRSQLESAIADALGCEPWEVIVHRKSVKHPAYQRPGGFDPDAIQVISRDEYTQTLDQFGELVVAKLPAVQRLHVIGPWQSDLPEAGRRQAREEWEKRIMELVLAHVGGRS